MSRQHLLLGEVQLVLELIAQGLLLLVVARVRGVRSSSVVGSRRCGARRGLLDAFLFHQTCDHVSFAHNLGHFVQHTISFTARAGLGGVKVSALGSHTRCLDPLLAGAAGALPVLLAAGLASFRSSTLLLRGGVLVLGSVMHLHWLPRVVVGVLGLHEVLGRPLVLLQSVMLFARGFVKRLIRSLLLEGRRGTGMGSGTGVGLTRGGEDVLSLGRIASSAGDNAGLVSVLVDVDITTLGRVDWVVSGAVAALRERVVAVASGRSLRSLGEGVVAAPRGVFRALGKGVGVVGTRHVGGRLGTGSVVGGRLGTGSVV